MADSAVYESIRRMLGNPTENELSEADLESYFEQALLEYAYAMRQYATITVTANNAYDMSNYARIIDVVGVFETTAPYAAVDFTYNTNTKELTTSDYSGEVKVHYIISYTYDEIPTIDRPYVKYLTAAFCLETIAAIRDRIPSVSSFKLVSGADIRSEGERYLEKWNSRFALSEVY